MAVVGSPGDAAERCMVANTSLAGFRAVSCAVDVSKSGLILPADACEALQVRAGDNVRYMPV